MKLSPHFSLDELVKSQTATRKGIPNEPSEAHTDALRALCMNILEPVRSQYSIPFSPSSGYRSAELCVAIGSTVNSQHAKGEEKNCLVCFINFLGKVWVSILASIDSLLDKDLFLYPTVIVMGPFSHIHFCNMRHKH